MNTDYFIINFLSLFMQILGQVTMFVTYGIGDLYTLILILSMKYTFLVREQEN